MHDVRIPFYDHEVGHVHRSGLCDASDIVTSEIDEHDVFGALLLISEEVGGVGVIGLGIGATRTGPGNRPGADHTVLHLDKHLG